MSGIVPITQAVVLVGGKGTRLGNLSRDVPKPLVTIGDDRPFLDHLVELLRRHGYTDIVLLAGYLGHLVEYAYHGRTVGEGTIRVVKEPEPLGTAGALMAARDVLAGRFLMLNGDALFDINLRALEVGAIARGGKATLALKAVEDVSRYGRVVVEDGRIAEFTEKDPTFCGPGLINGGIYVMQKAVLDAVTTTPCSMEQDVFPQLIREGAVHGIVFDGYFLDIGTPEALARAHCELPARRIRPAVFLDRDGVLNADDGYTFRPEDLRLLPGAANAVRWLNDHGFYVIVVSNQAGVARGYFTLADADKFNDALQNRLYASGAHVDCFYIAPYHPDGIVAPYAVDHQDRKPNPGMLLRAFADWPIDISRSFLIGDKHSDIEAAERAGIPGHLYAGSNLDAFVARIVNCLRCDCSGRDDAQRALTGPAGPD